MSAEGRQGTSPPNDLLPDGVNDGRVFREWRWAVGSPEPWLGPARSYIKWSTQIYVAVMGCLGAEYSH